MKVSVAVVYSEVNPFYVFILLVVISKAIEIYYYYPPHDTPCACCSCLFNGVIYPPFSFPSQQILSPLDLTNEFLLPTIVLWNPIISHHVILTCFSCKENLQLSSWNDGSLKYNTPRLIQDLKCHVLLVSAVYTCKNGHRILSHDERILKEINPIAIPFVLLHKTGFTKDFVNFCCTLCQSVMNFHSLEKAIAQMRWQYYEERKKVYMEYTSSKDTTLMNDLNISPYTEQYAKYLPSDDTICQCFVTAFLKNENLYRSNLQLISAGDILSVDHTYKIASNVGYLRSYQKWISQYDAVFLVFNKDGKIISWQFTKSGSYKEVKPILEAVANRNKTINNAVKTIYIDNCCQWRFKLQEVFGITCQVKLDIFHAIQRIVQKIPKKHPFHSQCAADLRQVFRHDGDHGIKRTRSTPCSAKMLANLNSFVHRWENIMYDGNHVLSIAALHEIENSKYI